MAIRIRVYPQPHSIGAMRNRALRRQRQLHRQELGFQRQLQRQQMQLRGMYAPAPYGSSFGSSLGSSIGGLFGSIFGGAASPFSGVRPWQVPSASGWGFGRSPYAPAYASTAAAWSGGYASQPYLPYAASYASPFSVAQYAGHGAGWVAPGC